MKAHCSEVTGYVPPEDWLDSEAVRYFGIPRGLSRLELEITLAAHKVDNPHGACNVLFWRN